MPGYSHLTADERDRIGELRADGLSLRAIARALDRAASTISRELRRNALDSGAYRPHVADGAYMARAVSAAILETDTKLAAYVTIAGRLRLGIETGLRAVCAETIYGWIYRAGQKTGRLWRLLTRRRARRRTANARAARDRIADKTHLSQRSSDPAPPRPARRWDTGRPTW